jgi:hypothetical protein
MRGVLGPAAACLLFFAATGGAGADPVDCGPAPTVKCLSAAVFSLARTLPEDSYFRRHVAFAEQELAPGDIKTALDYVVSDSPDPLPWEDIDWIAQAGRFDRATELAKTRTSPVARLGGLLAVAVYALDKNDKMRATRIVESVERELPSIKPDDDEAAGLLPGLAAEIRARLGQTERAARLLEKGGVASVGTLLSISGKYPAAASLREQAWREAERANDPLVWRLLLDDAKSRGDQADLARLAQSVSQRLDGVIADDHVSSVISLAHLLLAAGFPEPSARLIKPWPQWVKGKEAGQQFNIVSALVPVLAGLARDQDVLSAAEAVTNVGRRSQCLSKAAEEYFRLGRSDIASRLDAQALRAALSSPIGDPKLQWDHDAALHNLALARAGHGDIQGALDAASGLRDEKKIRDVTSYIVRRAIDAGYGPVAGPAIEALEQQASATQNPGLLLQVASDWYGIGEEELSRRSLAAAMKVVDERHSPSDVNDTNFAAELMWRIDGAGKAETMIGIVDKMGVNDPGAIDHLVEIMRDVSPAVAVQLSDRQSEVERRIDELANIAIKIADSPK